MAPQNTTGTRPPTSRRGRAIGSRSRGPARQGTMTRGLPTSSGSTAVARQSQNLAAPAFFPESNNAQIQGGQFSISRGPHTNVTINLNQPGYDTNDTSSGDHDETPIQPTRSLDSQPQPWVSIQRRPSLPVQRSCEIYYRQLVVKGRGSPLWVPAPNTQLPLHYRRQGISIGDVGIITDYGGFDFLFNICQPRGHPNNPEQLPEDFAPLNPPLMPSDVRGYSDFRPNSYLTSSSVTKSRRADSDPSGLTFESSNSEGAILTMPQGSKSRDLGSVMKFRRYTSVNAERWYRYAHDVHGREARNGDLRLVVGWDQSTTWGMATFAKTTAQNAFRLKFRSNRGSELGQMYDWESECGVFEGQAGPDAREMDELRAGDPDEEGEIYENQCLFVRTLNITLEDGVWNKLISETDMGFVLNDLTNTNPSPSLTSLSSSYSLVNNVLGSGSHSQGQLGNQHGLLADNISSPPYISELPTALAIHPSKYINDRLLKDSTNARMVITEDHDWMSVLTSDDFAMPSGEELYKRIMESYNMVEEDGIVYLESKQQKAQPGWVVEQSDVSRDKMIGLGFLSDVYRATWAGRAVVIKVLEPVRPQTFSRAMDLWTELHHPNVLSVYGGSNLPPFFFISPYMQAGTLVAYLKTVETKEFYPPSGLHATSWASPQYRAGSIDEHSRDRVLLDAIYEIAQGMEYLHSQGILHGDLKASNVFMDDNSTCVIADFGQTNMKNEAMKGSQLCSTYNDGCLRWKSPEFITDAILTEKVDIWAFAITCVEILTMGKIPWPLVDDTTVRNLILEEDLRPSIPYKTLANIPGLQDIIYACWQTQSNDRPSFMKITSDLWHLRWRFQRKKSATSSLISFSPASSIKTISLAMPIPVTAGASQEALEMHSAKSIISVAFFTSEPEPKSEGFDLIDDMLDEESTDEHITAARDARRYRLLLTHKYHPSLVLPLWEPSVVGVGAVGYLQRPAGKFITLFNAFFPKAATHPSVRILPSLNTYGPMKVGLVYPDKKSFAKKLLDTLPSSSVLGNTSSGVSFPLRASRKAAYIYAEDTEYRYMQTLDIPNRWLQKHVATVIEAYREDHNIEKEELFLVTGTLQTPHYALFVSHCHLDGNLSFNVGRPLKTGKPWGTFTIDNDDHQSSSAIANKISTHGDLSKTILVARLRMRPESLEASAF